MPWSERAVRKSHPRRGNVELPVSDLVCPRGLDLLTRPSILPIRFHASFFGTMARIPASRASSSIPSISKIVNRISGTVGSAADINLAASMPLMSGIDKSSKTTSGLSWSNFWTPDTPSSASPQTVHFRERRMAPSIRLVISESSTIKIRSATAHPPNYRFYKEIPVADNTGYPLGRMSLPLRIAAKDAIEGVNRISTQDRGLSCPDHVRRATSSRRAAQGASRRLPLHPIPLRHLLRSPGGRSPLLRLLALAHPSHLS